MDPLYLPPLSISPHQATRVSRITSSCRTDKDVDLFHLVMVYVDPQVMSKGDLRRAERRVREAINKAQEYKEEMHLKKQERERAEAAAAKAKTDK